jgi:hypothetical protein
MSMLKKPRYMPLQQKDIRYRKQDRACCQEKEMNIKQKRQREIKNKLN